MPSTRSSATRGSESSMPFGGCSGSGSMAWPVRSGHRRVRDLRGGGMQMRDVILVVQKSDHSLGYYDFETGRELGRVPVDPFPHEFTLSADRRTAYLASFGVALAEHPGPGGNTVAIVDVPGRKRIGTVQCGKY